MNGLTVLGMILLFATGYVAFLSPLFDGAR